MHWATRMQYKRALGNNFGYFNLNNILSQYVEKIVTVTEEADDSLIMIAPEFYSMRIPGKVNWLFTMFEGSIPEEYLIPVKRADYIITPTTWVKDLFDSHLKGSREVFVVPCGVSHRFNYKKRKLPNNKPFRFLWIGAPNPRKGWEEIIAVWHSYGFEDNPDVELYLKTTGVHQNLPRKMKNVILNPDKLSEKELIKLYHSAHCFLFPSRGEGFGFTLAEAMATGCPCIASNYSGHTDFFDEEVGFPINRMIDSTAKIDRRGIFNSNVPQKVLEIKIKMPDVNELAEKMVYVFCNYKEALTKGRKAHLRIKNKWTWERAARKLKEVILEVRNDSTYKDRFEERTSHEFSGDG